MNGLNTGWVVVKYDKDVIILLNFLSKKIIYVYFGILI